jgi:Putative DNA-binding domain
LNIETVPEREYCTQVESGGMKSVSESLILKDLREHLNAFAFQEVLNDLGWSKPKNTRPVPLKIGDLEFSTKEIAQLGGVLVLEVHAPDGLIPDSGVRGKVGDEVGKLYRENLLIFVDAKRTQSVWFWLKHDLEPGTQKKRKGQARAYTYLRGQPDDLIVSKLAPMFVDISEFDEDGNVGVIAVATKLKLALDTEAVTKRFYADFNRERLDFLEHIQGIEDDRDRAWYASVILNRMMFVYFLQRKGFLDQPRDRERRYLQNKFAESQARGQDRYYSEFLQALFFEGFAKPEDQRSTEATTMLGEIPYLNGGLFLPHPIEQRWDGQISINDQAFTNLLELFERYDWNLDDRPDGNPKEINPNVLGYIFEKYINQKEFGAYYTRPEITEYLCEQTIHKLVLEKINTTRTTGPNPKRAFGSLEEALTRLDAPLCRELLTDILPNLTLLDPACGSGAFLVSAMKTLVRIYLGLYGPAKAQFSSDPEIGAWIRESEKHRNADYFIKKRIITNNLYGVDLMEEAIEIAKLRLFLALVSSANTIEELEPLPNIDFNLLAGNSLIGMMHVDATEYDKRNPQHGLFTQPYPKIIEERLRDLKSYRNAAELGITDLRSLRNHIQTSRSDATNVLNEMLLEEFGTLKIKFEQATWDEAKNSEGKPKKRAVTIADVRALEPFHWGFEFSEVMARGGFDAIIANPPWDTFKPNAKEFFEQHSSLVSKKTMDIKAFEKEKDKLLQDLSIREPWLEYLSNFPHQSEYFRSTAQFANQSVKVNGKQTGGDVNLYKLFVEQCFNLLRDGGRCGIVIPSGIYTDLGTTGLRKMLFERSKLDVIFGLSNERYLFEGVDHRFKIALTVFAKGNSTESFTAAFRIDPREAIGADDLDSFLNVASNHMTFQTNLVKKLSPDSISVMEFKSELDVTIAKKMFEFPLLGEKLEGMSMFRLTNEFHMTNDSHLFQTAPGPGRLPVFEGKMIHQFTHAWGEPRYWVDEQKGRKTILGRLHDTGELLNYQHYRFAHRSIARSSDVRTMIGSILPANVFYGHSMNATKDQLNPRDLLYITAALNSFVLDFSLRQRVSANLTMFYIYQLPVPRLTSSDPRFQPIVTRAARLICTTPEYDDLARSAGLRDHTDGATDPSTRAQLRAELDGMIAHLYHLTESEFKHILGTFPVVTQEVKDAALEAFNTLEPKANDTAIAQLIRQGESATLEFKSSARWDVKQGVQNKEMEKIIVKTLAALLNSQGGTLLIGVTDEGSICGLEADYGTLKDRKNADGLEQFLTNLFGGAFGGHGLAPLIKISFHALESKEICKIEVKASGKPVWTKSEGQEYFYVRTNNSSRELKGREITEYLEHRGVTDESLGG